MLEHEDQHVIFQRKDEKTYEVVEYGYESYVNNKKVEEGKLNGAEVISLIYHKFHHVNPISMRLLYADATLIEYKYRED